MHESVPEPRYITSRPSYDDEDPDYDVYDFYPSRNELRLHSSFYMDWEHDEASSDSSESECSVITSPTYTIDPSFAFPDAVNDNNISNMGYSKFFRTGLWAQSAHRQLDALLENTLAKLRFLKKLLARHTSQTDL
ncbi:hypothetical protein C2E23DRAFT_887778 [Lenzites betulinus]|nr:hypothetical protein C2E23DRAFT_887778 [Lenzites betulinus]